MSTPTSSPITNARALDPDLTGLAETVARYRSADDQIHALEAQVLRQFAAIHETRDVTAKKDAFWSMTREMLQQSQRLISQESWAVLNTLGGSDLFWNPSWPWVEKASSEIGPPSFASPEDCDPTVRARHELRLFNLVLATVDHVLWSIAPNEFTDPRRSYDVELDGAYPFRWLDGEQAAVTIDADPANDLSQAQSDRIKPYVDPASSNADRASLYAGNLYCRPIIESDLLQPQERGLIGQWGVFARHRIAEGTCIGVYGGTLLDSESLIMLSDKRYLAKVTASGGPDYFVNGENILSLMNTMLLFDDTGRAVAQDTRPHNVHAQSFRCQTANGIPLSLVAFFAANEIEADEELRWNYGYDDVALIRHGLRDVAA